MTKKSNQPFGVGANKAGRDLVQKMETARMSQKKFETVMKNKLAERGISQEWMKNHLIIEVIK